MLGPMEENECGIYNECRAHCGEVEVYRGTGVMALGLPSCAPESGL